MRPAVGSDPGGGFCPRCGRHYSGAVLEEAGAETICLPSFVEVDDAIDRNATAPLPDAAALFDDVPTLISRPGAPRRGRDAADEFDGLLPDPEVAPASAAPPPDGDESDADRGGDQADMAETMPLSDGGPMPRSTGDTPFEPGDLAPGTQMQHFRIEAPLGRGGMGAVYRALDLSLERFVAVKVIRPDRARRSGSRGKRSASDAGSSPASAPGSGSSPTDSTSPDSSPGWGPAAGVFSTGSGSVALDRLLQEARAQARVNHPNVVHVYFVSPDPDQPFLAMELVEGATLATVLKDGPLPYGAVTRIGEEIASALACAAKFDIVHGDVKPSNVLLAGARDDRPGRLGTVKLSDFGLARRKNRARTGGLEGTPNYLAPEIVRGGAPTAQSDLYALGVTLFEMTFGRLPYTTRRQGLSHRLGAHLTGVPEFPDPWPADLPPAWRNVLARLLEKDPADRPADAREAAREIRGLAPQSGTRAGLLVRSLAALTDLAAVLLASWALFTTIALPAAVGVDRSLSGMLRAIPLALIAKAAGCAPSLLFAWWQARARRTPGKLMFQVRVVDRYGLPPTGRTLFVRGLAQTFPVWGLVLGQLAEDLTGLRWLEQSLVLFVLTVWLIDIGAGLVSGLISRKTLTLHDRLLGTRVVLDTADRSE